MEDENIIIDPVAKTNIHGPAIVPERDIFNNDVKNPELTPDEERTLDSVPLTDATIGQLKKKLEDKINKLIKDKRENLEKEIVRTREDAKEAAIKAELVAPILIERLISEIQKINPKTARFSEKSLNLTSEDYIVDCFDKSQITISIIPQIDNFAEEDISGMLTFNIHARIIESTCRDVMTAAVDTDAAKLATEEKLRQHIHAEAHDRVMLIKDDVFIRREKISETLTQRELRERGEVRRMGDDKLHLFQPKEVSSNHLPK